MDGEPHDIRPEDIILERLFNGDQVVGRPLKTLHTIRSTVAKVFGGVMFSVIKIV
jgi:hypothetical protein